MRMNISVPDELAAEVRAHSLPVSAICQRALRDALRPVSELTATQESMLRRIRALEQEVSRLDRALADLARRGARKLTGAR